MRDLVKSPSFSKEKVFVYYEKLMNRLLDEIDEKINFYFDSNHRERYNFLLNLRSKVETNIGFKGETYKDVLYNYILFKHDLEILFELNKKREELNNLNKTYIESNRLMMGCKKEIYKKKQIVSEIRQDITEGGERFSFPFLKLKHLNSEIENLKKNEKKYEELSGQKNNRIIDLAKEIYYISSTIEKNAKKIFNQALIILNESSEIIDFVNYIRENPEHQLNKFVVEDNLDFDSNFDAKSKKYSYYNLVISIPVLSIRESIIPYLEARPEENFYNLVDSSKPILFASCIVNENSFRDNKVDNVGIRIVLPGTHHDGNVCGRIEYDGKYRVDVNENSIREAFDISPYMFLRFTYTMNRKIHGLKNQVRFDFYYQEYHFEVVDLDKLRELFNNIDSTSSFDEYLDGWKDRLLKEMSDDTKVEELKQPTFKVGEGQEVRCRFCGRKVGESLNCECGARYISKGDRIVFDRDSLDDIE